MAEQGLGKNGTSLAETDSEDHCVLCKWLY